MKLTTRQTIPRSVQQREYPRPPRFRLAYAARGGQRNELTAPEPHCDCPAVIVNLRGHHDHLPAAIHAVLDQLIARTLIARLVGDLPI